MTRILALCLALTALSGCASWPFDRPLWPFGQSEPDDTEFSELKTEILAYLSEERLKLNSEAKPLTVDPELSAAAQAHSETMASNGAFDGGNASENAAIEYLTTNTTFQGYVGESSAMQYFTPEAGIDAVAYARRFVDQWLMNPEHRQTIAYTNFDRTGIGVSANGNTIFVSQLFATDFGLPPPPPSPEIEDPVPEDPASEDAAPEEAVPEED